MSLRFIYGRSGSGKSYFCTESIKNSLSKGVNNKIILLVPEQFSFQAEKNLIQKVGATGLLNVEVLSFKRLAHRVFSEVGGLIHKNMDDSGKCMLIYKIMMDTKDELKVFNTAAKQQGFATVIADLITEFKNYNVTPQALIETSNSIEEDQFLAKKIRDIGIIYDKFVKVINKGYIDPEDYLTILYNKIDYYEPIKNSEIWIDEFNYFTPQQYKIIEKFLKLAKRVNITLCMNTSKNKGMDGGIFNLTEKTEKKLIDIAMNNNISLDKPVELWKKPYPRFKDSKEISYLESNFFNYNCTPYKGHTKDIKILKSANLYSEVENVAKDIIKLCRDKGFRFKDIAVVSRDLAIYENTVKAIFSEYEIPNFIDRKKDIDDNPLIILIKASIEIFTKNWSYQSIFRYLKTGLLDIDEEDIFLLENYVLACGIKGKNKWTGDKKWENFISYNFEKEIEDEEKEKMLQRINEIRYKVAEPLLELWKNIHGRHKAVHICTSAFNFLCSIGVPEKIESWVDKFKEDGNQQLSREYSSIWNLVMELLDEVVEVVGEEEVTLEEFIDIITIGFSHNKMGLIPPALDQVLVSSIDRIKSHNIKALYIIGVNDGIFPKGNWEEGVFTDLDRITLRNSGIELASDTKTKALEEQFLIYSSLTIASDYLRISYPIADHEGKALRPSMIISRLKRVYSRIEEQWEEMDEAKVALENIYRKVPTFNKLITLMRRDNSLSTVDPVWKQVHLWYKNNRQWRETYKRVISGFEYDNQMKKLNSDSVQKLYGKNIRLSVSRLERYVECPFAYYIQYGLKAKERKIFKLSSPDIGTFMHKVIDDFSETVRKNQLHWGDLSKEWCEKNIDISIDKIINDTSGSILNSSARYRYLMERLKKVLLRAIWLIVTHMKQSGFQPLGYEMIFGEDGDFPPIEISLSNGEKVNLIGRIDRVDKLVGEEGVFYRIIDYKSGNKDFKLSDVYYGLQIQLITYLDAIIKAGNGENGIPSLPAGVLYFKLQDPIIKGNKNLTEEEIEKAIMKELKMKGLILKDTEIVKEMDRDIEGISLIIPAEIKKDGNLSSRSSTATKEQFEELREHVRNNLVKSCEQMLDGDIGIKPYRKKESVPCKYCIFSSICQFDDSIESNKYNSIKELKDHEVWEKLDEELGGKDSGEGDN
ncbi:helicase-exonuclease AddAB subunit AddB [Haloimpatiens massiliensis]|uniref:helicase-exonuclease AddAB subunit AddB n=1 Tax=Haloimpatiens massiliensis TaxID=1658110 RepID=UPI000C8422A6|nr:helicase-exonuclease AddAB subunit AddB [Haloimpatiens massiliensis]